MNAVNEMSAPVTRTLGAGDSEIIEILETVTADPIIHQLHGAARMLGQTPERIRLAKGFEKSGQRYMRVYETTHVGGRVTHDVLYSDSLEGLSSATPADSTEVFTWYLIFEWDLGINLVQGSLVD